LTSTVLHAKLKSINEIMTLNTWATTVPTYTFGIIWWSQTDMWPVVPWCQIN